eukprot:Pgem_evm1s5152
MSSQTPNDKIRSKNYRKKHKSKQAQKYEAPQNGPIHAFRAEEKKYKLYKNASELPDFSSVIDFHAFAYNNSDKDNDKDNNNNNHNNSSSNNDNDNDNDNANENGNYTENPNGLIFEENVPLFRGNKKVYGIRSHPGFLFIPSALDLEEQAMWITRSVTTYMHERSNLTTAPTK